MVISLDIVCLDMEFKKALIANLCNVQGAAGRYGNRRSCCRDNDAGLSSLGIVTSGPI